MVKKRPNISILPLLLIVILCISWLTQLSRQDEMTYDQMVQLFEQQKVESFQFTDSSTLVMKLKDSEQPVRRKPPGSSHLTAIRRRTPPTGWRSFCPT